MQFRKERLKKSVQRHVDDWLRKEAELPGMINFYLTDVIVANDLSYIKLYVHWDTADSMRDVLLRQLNTLSPKLRYFMSSRISLKRIPKFKFYYDEQEDQVRIVRKAIDALEVSDSESNG